MESVPECATVTILILATTRICPVPPAAYTSNQIAQRNLQIGSSCSYSITNTNTTSANLLLGISMTPATPAPGASGGPTVSLVIGDPGGVAIVGSSKTFAARRSADTSQLACSTERDWREVRTHTTDVGRAKPSILAGLLAGKGRSL
jgi:hypothetical protein